MEEGSLEVGRPNGKAIALTHVRSDLYVLSTSCEPGALLGTGDTAVNETEMVPALLSL